MEVQKADISAQSDYQRDKKEQVLQETKKLFEEIIEEKTAFHQRIKDQWKRLDGYGVPQEKKSVKFYPTSLDQVLEDPQLNERETLTRDGRRKEG